MSHRFLLSIVMLAIVITAVSFIAAPIAGQTPKATASTARAWTPPKTSWGDPDLQGIYTSDDYINTGLQRQDQFGTRLYLTDQEIADRQTAVQRAEQNSLQEFATPNGNVGTGPPGHWGERARRAARQTSLIVDPEDGKMPALTEEGRQRQLAASNRQGAGTARPAGSWEEYTFYIRCITRGVAGSVLPVIYGNGSEIVQGPGYVAILQEMVHEARIIPLDGRPHVGKGVRTYMGDSRGHWEGNTLVIETTNFLPNKTGIGLNGGGAPTSEDLRLVERLTRMDKDTIQYELLIDDAKTFTKPWKVSFPIRQEPGYQQFEYACHEGNYGMMNQLSASRAAEKADEEAARQK